MPSKDQIARYTDVARNVLDMCKKVQPDFWNPEAHPDMPKSWGYSFSLKPYAPSAYYEAVGSFYASPDSAGGQRPGVGDIVKHALMVVSAWESHPVKSAELNAHRDALRDERDRQLADGSFSELRGYVLSERRALPREGKGAPEFLEGLLSSVGAAVPHGNGPPVPEESPHGQFPQNLFSSR